MGNTSKKPLLLQIKLIKVSVLLLGLVFISGIRNVQADSVELWYICGSGACPDATTLFGSGFLDQTSYYPGQTVIYNAYMESDDNPQPVSGISPIAKASIDGGPYSADVFPGIYSPQALRDGILGSTIIGVAPNVSVPVVTSWGAGGYSPDQCGMDLIVNPSPTPTLEIHFGFFNRIKEYLSVVMAGLKSDPITDHVFAEKVFI